MWFLDYIPDAFIHLLLIVGVLGTVIGFFISIIPFVNQYKLPIQIVSILILALGLYLEGGIAYQEKTAKEIAELKEKLADANAKAEKTNVQIVTKVVKDTKIVKQRGEEIVKIVEVEVEKFNNQCIIPKEVVDLHNRAVNLNGENTEKVKEETNKLKLSPRISP